MCKQSNKLPFVYNVPIGRGAVNGKVQFTASDYSHLDNGGNNFCFAGQDDELVAAASVDHGLYIWSLPNDQQVAGDQVVDKPLVVLRGHKDDIYAVRYNRRRDMLASAGEEKIIKLWTPIAQQ